MDCNHCQDALIDYAHGELEGEHREALSGHLASCSECALEYCRLEADLGGIARAYRAAPSPAVADALRERVAAEFAPPWWRRAWMAWSRPIPAYGAVAVALIPVALWIATAYVGRAADETNLAERPPIIENYDASTMLRHSPSLL